jgi:hypothetical protein
MKIPISLAALLFLTLTSGVAAAKPLLPARAPAIRASLRATRSAVQAQLVSPTPYRIEQAQRLVEAAYLAPQSGTYSARERRFLKRTERKIKRIDRIQNVKAALADWFL